MAGHKLRSAFFYTESKLKELKLTRTRADAAMQLAYGLWTSTHQKKYEEELLLIAELSKAQLLADERMTRLNRQHSASGIDSIVRKVKRLQDAIIYYQHEQVTAPGNKNIAGLLQAAEYDLSLLNKRVGQQQESDSAAQDMLTLASLHVLFQRIPAGVTVLEFFEGSDSSYFIEMDNRGINGVQLLANGKELHQNVQAFMRQWFAKGPSAMMNAPRLFYEQCYQLYAAIFSTYHWEQDRRYLLIPDGVLSYLPFDALLTNQQYKNDYKQWPWLCKQVSLSQAYSLQTWYQQQTAQYTAEGFTGFFVPKGKDSQQPVLSVMQEYQALRGMIKGDYYVDSAASWNSFNSHTANAHVLHISSHAMSSVQDSFPYLQLYDQPFYLFDLRYRSFSPALVVLGACKTADGEWLAGEGVNSLSRGFTAAGAGGVVSGLWNVNDEAAISMVQEFYRQLQQGQDPAMALHRAKIQWLQQHTDNAMLQLPYYWAGLVYSGQLQPVAVHGNQHFTWYYVAGGVLLVLLAVVLLRRRLRRAQGRPPYNN
jgi:CHAT domain-containing protein